MKINPTSYWASLLRVLFPLLLFSFSFAQPSPDTTELYLKCQTTFMTCGDVVYTEIKFPFWTNDQPEDCGHPGYYLTCDPENKTLSMNINDKQYRVRQKIDYKNQFLDLIDADLSAAVTTASSCPEKITNTSISSLESSYLTYVTNDINLTLYLNCSISTILTPGKLFPIPCTSSFPEFFGQNAFFTLAKEHIEFSENEQCNATVLIPVYDQFNLGDFINGTKSFSDVLKVGFGVKWTIGQGWCDDCTSSGGICGYNVTSPNSTACFCPAGYMTNGTSCFQRGTTRRTNKKLIITGVVSGFAFILALCCLYLYCCCRPKGQQHSFTLYGFACWQNSSKDQTIETFLQKHGTLLAKRYSYSEVKKITKSFRHKLGQGGFGSVFKGTLSDGHAVAVKVLNSTDKDGDGEDFLNEVASIGRTSHINIVSLMGFCFQGSKRSLIYDFMPNGSLEKYIYAEDPKTILGWEKLFQIAIGISRGLEYLHRGCNTKIVHFDIKPHNILLDEDFCPKISDFGLAKFGTHKESILSLAGTRGTIGYIAPEVFSRNFGTVSSKSDVYSYGMMVLEMAGGRKNVKVTADRTSEIYFPHWIYEHLDEDAGMEHCGVTTDTQDIARKLIIVGLWCIQTRPESRPTMSKVVEMLEGSINDLELPPKPYLFSPPRSPAICSTISIS
ncbi:Glycerophosphodiester phosphodiesterase protein [Dioscorea alata]|uniref:Glycerophosphodiester phosphodiesterase protein n=1 Tax=Dioscorea alata TaxID=55571 RepID=A0ACB7W4Q8_DIOAL|nr:Glycerophosphodiester phosphodiesterase protein [Dioscorea alata]